jgi:uncharacterized protein (DUF1810 family)
LTGRGLERFLEAQDSGVYAAALAELRAGHKRSHWMWFVFPQIAGLRRSPTAVFYAIADRSEAQRFLAHETLGSRLRECTEAVLSWAGRRSDAHIFGEVDALKLRSSMTLFDAVGEEDLFARVLAGFVAGGRDQATLDRL